jgi:hypothetical protein
MDSTVTGLLAANLHGVFGERDPERRRATAAATYTEDVRFTDPEETVVGLDALEAKAAALLEGAPGLVFADAGPAFLAGERGALSWTLAPEGGEPVARGLDVITVRDGRISEIFTLLAAG